MLYPLSILSLFLLVLIHLTHGHEHARNRDSFSLDTVTFATRAHWMRRANQAVAEFSSPCFFKAFGSVVVNHTDLSSGPEGKLVCTGVNDAQATGDPTIHG